ncbi:hypothetical protein BDV96DRAFT_606249 [Lophiotrema nucula]|uniref:Uncharacterized protein n=1 Tax=Lophiotrema nucula TaxID=690887 RepID=A0A6A5YND0_9PLEO|nr:hypothetical protein BDV96DRAFT_606249 [Lophiotrema nucula]
MKGSVSGAIDVSSATFVPHYTSFQRDEVDAYLKQHLQWKFVLLGGAEKPASDFPDTLISVWRGSGEPRDAEDGGAHLPPRYGDYVPIHQATHGKLCGLKSDDAVLGEHAYS